MSGTGSNETSRRWFRFYNFRFIKGPLVVVHLQHTYESNWQCVRGVQIGPWFIGGIKGVTRQIEEASHVGE